MKTLLTFITFFIFFATNGFAQSADTSLPVNNTVRHNDQIRADAARDSALIAATRARTADSLKRVEEARRKQFITNVQQVLANHPWFNFDGTPVSLVIEPRQQDNDDADFYFIIGLVLYLALMRLIFYKYLSTMFTLFFRASLRHQQLREQMLQAPLPAMLMNLFFIVSLAAYCTFLAGHFQLPFARHFGYSVLYLSILLALIYIGKFIILKIAGWIFDISGATDTYIFIVFLINKMVGVLLLPILILMAFPTSYSMPPVLTVSYVLLAGMFIYRYIIAYKPLRSEIKLNRLHFFLYLCAFEIAPLILIYKVLLEFVYSIFNI